MIYIGSIRMFLVPFLSIGIAALATKLMRFDSASRSLCYGLVGALAWFALAPLIGALVGSVPHVMIERRYFVETYIGCISPYGLLKAYLTSFFGSLVGFLLGGFIGFRGSLPA